MVFCAAVITLVRSKPVSRTLTKETLKVHNHALTGSRMMPKRFKRSPQEVTPSGMDPPEDMSTPPEEMSTHPRHKSTPPPETTTLSPTTTTESANNGGIIDDIYGFFDAYTVIPSI
ncbi:hypothetical protein HNY73_013917 [Argiope bruennichi]|uniref:Uncharacterized protein n=1 Tax=Argiope bruennichi TaxID=94029 RepID=A0A8T0ERA7_ARGBR|nr:hypothetical protein HNY73_013917 [Argiope bruennichi]